jgi:hypothetical protein
MVRLAVLYEDLRIEMSAVASRAHFKTLDHLGDGYRRLYFIRRAIASMVEVRGAFERLDQLPEFQEMAKVLNPKEKSDWNAAVDFFSTHKAEFKQMRDDFGGHFQETTALYALENVDATAVGFITIRAGTKPDTAGPMLEFVQEIVSVAMVKHKGEREWQDYYEETLRLLIAALKHLTRQVHILSYHYFWPRFGG